MAEPVVTVIIVTYESEDTIDAALLPGKAAHDVGLARYIVVDNDSSDQTVATVRERHPWVTVVENGENIGFGRGCNVGLAQARTPYVLFLNPDAAMEVQDLRTLVGFMEEHPSAALAAPAIVRGNGQYQIAGGLPTPWRVLKSAAGFNGFPERRPIEAGKPPFQTDWICGAVLIGRVDVLRELGGFDPRFFLYFDETDLCRRLLDRGYEVWAVGEAVARHASNASARKVQPDLEMGGCLVEHFFPSRLYYLWKHHGVINALLADMGEVACLALRDLVRCALRRRPKANCRRRLRGPVCRLPSNVSSRKGPFRKRSRSSVLEHN